VDHTPLHTDERLLKEVGSQQRNRLSRHRGRLREGVVGLGVWQRRLQRDKEQV
jgi:hypothetical protein